MKCTAGPNPPPAPEAVARGLKPQTLHTPFVLFFLLAGATTPHQRATLRPLGGSSPLHAIGSKPSGFGRCRVGAGEGLAHGRSGREGDRGAVCTAAARSAGPSTHLSSGSHPEQTPGHSRHGRFCGCGPLGRGGNESPAALLPRPHVSPAPHLFSAIPLAVYPFVPEGPRGVLTREPRKPKSGKNGGGRLPAD